MTYENGLRTIGRMINRCPSSKPWNRRGTRQYSPAGRVDVTALVQKHVVARFRNFDENLRSFTIRASGIASPRKKARGVVETIAGGAPLNSIVPLDDFNSRFTTLIPI